MFHHFNYFRHILKFLIISNLKINPYTDKFKKCIFRILFKFKHRIIFCLFDIIYKGTFLRIILLLRYFSKRDSIQVSQAGRPERN